MKKTILVLTIFLAGLAGIISTQPDEFHVERSATFNAPAAVVFDKINSLDQWHSWSPWARLDPNAKTTFEGPKAGVGAIMRWEGNKEVGVGSMTITESTKDNLVKFQLDFLKPMQATNTATFSFKTENKQTTVTWSMDGRNNFIGKAISLVMNCEKMVGSQFEQGFTNLKEIVEPKAKG